MKLLIAGDFVPRNRLAPLVANENFEAIFGDIRKLVMSVDYSVVNFESPVVEDGDTPIDKCGPNLRCTAQAVDAIKYAGFKCVTLANNHVRDFGDNGVARTIDLMEKNKIDHVGAGENIEVAASVLYHKEEDKTLAIINCCESEFSIATPNHYGANPLNPVRQYYAIQDARRKADYVLVIVHGGPEHHQLPSPRMQDTYRFFVDAGADIVVNHHQHCYSGYEIYNGKPIVYGTGNFCMDKSPIRTGQNWNYGYLVLWDTELPNQIQLYPYEQCGENPGVKLLPLSAFDKKLGELNDIIINRESLQKETNIFFSSREASIDNVVEPIQNKYLSALRKRGLFPKLLPKRQRLRMQDYVMCESLRDIMEYYFNSKNNK